MPRIDLIALRSGTAAQWAAANPVLAADEPGYETDTNTLKIGDGSTPWSGLVGITGGGGGALEQGVSFPDLANNYYYVVFGVDGAWEAVRFRPGSDETSTGPGQTGARPADLPALQGLTYS